MGSQSELEFLRSKNLELQSTLDSVSEAYRNASQMREEFRQETVDLKNKNRLLQESVNRLQEACSQYETDLDEARNLAEIHKEERDVANNNLQNTLDYHRHLQQDKNALERASQALARSNLELRDEITVTRFNLKQAREYRDKIQVATGHKGVVDVNVNGEVVIKINVK